MPMQDCPLCYKLASVTKTDYGRSKTINCKACTIFTIGAADEAKIKDAPADWKKKLSEQAINAPQGCALRIQPSGEQGLLGVYVELKSIPQ